MNVIWAYYIRHKKETLIPLYSYLIKYCINTETIHKTYFQQDSEVCIQWSLYYIPWGHRREFVSGSEAMQLTEHITMTT